MGLLINGCTGSDTILIPFGDEVKNKFDLRFEDQDRNMNVVISSDDILEISLELFVDEYKFKRPYINFRLTEDGGEWFYQLTAANLGSVIHTYFENTLFSSATIQMAIRDNIHLTLSIDEIKFLIGHFVFSQNELDKMEGWLKDYWWASVAGGGIINYARPD